jgi:hypothetical protein
VVKKTCVNCKHWGFGGCKKLSKQVANESYLSCKSFTYKDWLQVKSQVSFPFASCKTCGYYNGKSCTHAHYSDLNSKGDNCPEYLTKEELDKLVKISVS